jgi:hypothetical protein
MPNDLHDRDILSWSEHQADLLRRLARGERVNDVDWEHVVEEIEDVGLSELNAVRCYLRLMLVHLLKLQGWPDSPVADHWRRAIASFQSDAVQRFAPSMRQRVDLASLYARAISELKDTRFDDLSLLPWSAVCPVDLDELLNEDRGMLEARFSAALSNDQH